ncbi:hypothetical protein EBZ39_05865 [bacterium]|nr:hypothetical protein [bacterium]
MKNSDDPVPEVSTLTLEMRKKAQDLSTKVRCGLHIRNFPTFEFSINQFVIDCLVWFEFSKNELMLKTIEGFSFANGKILSKSPPHVSIHGEKILVRYDVVAEIRTDLDFHHFPLEDHRLAVVLVNNTASIYEMFFNDLEELSFTISPRLFISNWRPKSLMKISGYEELRADEYKPTRTVLVPKVAFIINFEKKGLNKILIIFIPIFAAIFFSFFTFLMSFNSYQGKTNLAITAVTALLGYRFVIQQMSPSIGYFTLTDKLFVFFLVMSVVILVFQILLLRHYMFLMDREKIRKSEQVEVDTHFLTPRFTERINSYVYFSMLLFFLIYLTKALMS